MVNKKKSEESPIFTSISEIINNGIDRGSVQELPWWLATPLLQASLIDISIPKAFGQKSREDLQMGSWAINLYELCPYFYRMASKLLPMYFC